MAVIYYGEGDHEAGFVGFRVATTIGSNSNYKQAYFSLNEYSYRMAELLANQLNEKWKLEAEQVKLKNMTTKLRKNSGPHIIAQGIKAKICVERKFRGGESKAYFSPCFSVKIPSQGKGDTVFRTSKHGYTEAYKKAVDLHCDIHGLTDTQYVELLGRIPSPSLFTEHLVELTQNRGHNVTKSEILKKLNLGEFTDGLNGALRNSSR